MTVAKSIKLMKVWMYILGIILIIVMTGLLIYSAGNVNAIGEDMRRITLIGGLFLVFALSYWCGACVAIRATLESEVKHKILSMEQILPK